MLDPDCSRWCLHAETRKRASALDGAPVVPVSIGHAHLEAGTSEDVEITADYPLSDGADYIAMLHSDTDGDSVYSFGEGMTDVDGPALTPEDAPYVQGFVAGSMM